MGKMGNPGVTKFYTEFLRKLHEQLGYTVWILSHAGHELPLTNSIRQAPPLRDNEKIYNLEGQVNHKRAFIENYVPKNARIHFIGHSIGAYIILQLLKDKSIKERSQGIYLLFPTIEYMAQSRNGWFFTHIVQYFIWLIVFLCWIYTLLPSLLQIFLIKLYMIFFSVSNSHTDTIQNFIRPDTMEKVFFLAVDEMHLVKERDSVVLYENRDKIKLYYGAADRWVPLEYCRRLKRDIPDIHAEICTHNFEHAFVLRHPQEVAVLVANWIMQ
ncbi:hypothetical protein RN001_014274 [Aquatica leii]|uniref:Lipid droplet-associated hydrolase n=1 Tax=Aquatica leii TaxID=1421715 RepID=A0AAN7P1C9_9COLE|nr:hypothetical protein RN001_014274 [Aquatica leii]